MKFLYTVFNTDDFYSRCMEDLYFKLMNWPTGLTKIHPAEGWKLKSAVGEKVSQVSHLKWLIETGDLPIVDRDNCSSRDVNVYQQS